MVIYLIRHGETIEGRAGLILGHYHGTLTKVGVTQSREAAKEIGDATQIITSDLRRALDSTRLIQQIKKIPYVEDFRLRERNYGIYNGKPIDELISNFGSFDFEEAPQDGESFQDFRSRVDSFYQTLSCVDNIAIMSHAGVIMRIIERFGLQKCVPKNGKVIIIK